MTELSTDAEQWPSLPWGEWEATATTLHMWTQIVGKTRLELTPLQNHWWNVPLYVTARGLSTSAMPCGDDDLDIEFDFIAHELHFRLSSGKSLALPLRAQTVADFYAEYMASLALLGVRVKIDPTPCELANPIRFDLDTIHESYDREQAHRFWEVLRRVNAVFKDFSCGFEGKISPVHFFWGAFDLAVTRFSGRVASGPPRPDRMQQEAYSHEVSSLGFWPGNGGFGAAAFYSYAAPVPAGMGEIPVRPGAAGWNSTLGEFILKYDDVRNEAAPAKTLLEFAQSTYEAAANAAKWDRAALERPLPAV